MSYIDLKNLKQNPGTTAKFVINSKAEKVEKEYSGGSFTVFDYDVLVNNQFSVLSASVSLHRKLMAFSIGDTINLTYDSFTKEGKLTYYWKVEGELTSETKTFEQTQKSVNEFDAMLKKEQAKQEKPFVNNGARFGMIFNNTFKLYVQKGMTWTEQEFKYNFNKIETFVNVCENQDEPEQPKPQAVEQHKPVVVDEDELPF